MSVRAVVGLLAAAVSAFGGYLFALTVLFPGWPALTVLTPTVVTSVGLFSGAGASLVWLRWEATWWPNLRAVIVTIAAGTAGAWGGFAVGSPTSVDQLIPQIGVSAAATGAVLGANLGAAALFLAYVRRP